MNPAKGTPNQLLRWDQNWHAVQINYKRPNSGTEEQPTKTKSWGKSSTQNKSHEREKSLAETESELERVNLRDDELSNAPLTRDQKNEQRARRNTEQRHRKPNPLALAQARWRTRSEEK
jgi:hypothetical protein